MNDFEDDVNYELLLDLGAEMRLYELAVQLEVVFYVLMVATVVMLHKRGQLEQRAPAVLAVLALAITVINYILLNTSLIVSINEQMLIIFSWASHLNEISLLLSFVLILRARLLVPPLNQVHNGNRGGES
ncbi:MAG: hypothetical protein KTR16_15920 [Acidiferrobacterales bacterium]|nr:hypothetical protein [Acidiferrobacterales bacterium]